jgi:hypothetical protein
VDEDSPARPGSSRAALAVLLLAGFLAAGAWLFLRVHREDLAAAGAPPFLVVGRGDLAQRCASRMGPDEVVIRDGGWGYSIRAGASGASAFEISNLGPDALPAILPFAEREAREDGPGVGFRVLVGALAEWQLTGHWGAEPPRIPDYHTALASGVRTTDVAPGALAVLAGGLASRRPEVRVFCAQELAQIADARMFEALVAYLRRAAAAAAPADAERGPRAEEPIVRALPAAAAAAPPAEVDVDRALNALACTGTLSGAIIRKSGAAPGSPPAAGAFVDPWGALLAGRRADPVARAEALGAWLEDARPRLPPQILAPR